jgi:hypothetical protein
MTTLSAYFDISMDSLKNGYDPLIDLNFFCANCCINAESGGITFAALNSIAECQIG